MKIRYIPTDKEVKDARKEEYLTSLPIAEQLEALIENAIGRPEKLNAIASKIQKIKAKYPKQS